MVSQVEMKKLLIAGVLEESKSANFECLFQENIPFDEPTSFDGDYEPKNTLKFTFLTGDSPSKPGIFLCTPYLHIIRELSRRLQYKYLI